MLRRVHVAPAATAAQPPPSSSSSVTSSRSSATTATATPSFVYALPIRIPSPYVNQSLELQFDRNEYDVLVRLFSILDSESRGSMEKETVREFVGLRCPVFRRRDRALRKFGQSTTTFDEAWDAVMECSSSDAHECVPNDMAQLELGLEGWMVLCRLIALAQYQEAKRRFSERHSQQTMRHKTGGTEVVLVDVLPPDPPEPLHSSGLAQHQAESTTSLALPEMDLDHCLLSAHDISAEQELRRGKRARVEVKVFGSTKVAAKGGASALLASVSTSSPSAKSSKLDFIVTFYPIGDRSSPVVVRRSFADMIWLYETFVLHKKPGGTLCGRILPPFPSTSSTSESSDEAKSSITGSVVAAGSSAAVAAASAGVGMITSVAKSAKSLLGGYVSSSSGKSADAKRPGGGKMGRSGGWSYGREDTTVSATDKAGQVERYLNYLLEHPALCTSFPLNVILKASQSGLDSAKRILDDNAKEQDRRRRQQLEITQTDESGSASAYVSSTLLSRLPTTESLYSYQPNLSWVRSAAQAAVALKLHGVLETTGMPSASAKLQHASLPNFDNGKQQYSEEDVSPKSSDSNAQERGASNDKDSIDCFENGVVAVASELDSDACGDGDDDGYDMLPSPMPPPEQAVLTTVAPSGDISVDTESANKLKDGSGARYDYGLRIGEAVSPDDSTAVLGDLSVDRDIDKLREVIGSVDNLLSRCLSAGARIGRAKRKENDLHMSILRGMDSWEGVRGELVSQRALLDGVSTLEIGNGVSESSYASLKDDLSWQSALASSAVSAAEDVRSAVRACRTAARAKLAAEAASGSAQKACETSRFATPEDARAAQTKASIAKSHAIHSAVIEHEALVAKRRATMALAHDVKCWNVHRKRELLSLCRNLAREQREASHQSLLAWDRLLEGFVGTSPTTILDVQGEPVANARAAVPAVPEVLSFSLDSSIDTFGLGSSIERTLPAMTSGTNASHDELPVLGMSSSAEQSISPTALAKADPLSPLGFSNQSNHPDELDRGEIDGGDDTVEPQQKQELTMEDMANDASILSFNERSDDLYSEDASNDDASSSDSSSSDSSSGDSSSSGSSSGSSSSEDSTSPDDNRPFTDPSSINSTYDSRGFESDHDGADEPDDEQRGQSELQTSEAMSGSMQSIVDGLMEWGDQYDSTDDISLPSGMAVSMMLEEAGVVGKPSLSDDGIDPDLLG